VLCCREGALHQLVRVVEVGRVVEVVRVVVDIHYHWDKRKMCSNPYHPHWKLQNLHYSYPHRQ
jgi:hypothetical protein